MKAPLAPPPKAVARQAPRVLVVDDESDLIELIGDVFERDLDCRLVTASSVAEARRILQTGPIQLLVTDMGLPDGSGDDLLLALRKHQPLASAIVITGAPSMDGAISAMRQGAVDFVAKPFNVTDLVDRIRRALYEQNEIVKSESRIDRLRGAVRRLNDARKLVTRKVDLLCNDLVSAYGELSRQLDAVRITESFRSVVNNSRDLEQMLCHAMDWLLRQLGYSNVAIWLAAEEGFQLGAYMKYTIAGDEELVQAMRDGLLPIVARDGFCHFKDHQINSHLNAIEKKYLSNQTLLGVHCTYLGESLATLVMFRDASKPFTDEDAATLKAICPVFAIQLATMVGASSDDEAEENDDENGGVADEEDRSNKQRRRDDADWWKRGERPPF